MRQLFAAPVFVLGALSGGAAVAVATTQFVQTAIAAPSRATSSRVFEIRTYTVADGQQLAALHRRFRDHTIGIFNAHGMTSIGYWTPMDTALAQTTLIYLLAHPSREAAAQNWTAFRNDPEWQRVRGASEAAGLMVKKVESVFVEPTDFSPIK